MDQNSPYGGMLEHANVDFGRVRDGRRPSLFYIDVDLTTARVKGTSPLILKIAGDSFYSDADPINQGNAVVQFQDTSQSGSAPAPVYVYPGFIAQVPFTEIAITNAAQPGKRLRIFYGVNIDFRTGLTPVPAALPVNYSQNLTLNGLGYFHGFFVAAVAAQYSHAQLYNPVGSGRTLKVNKIEVASIGATSAYFMGRRTTQLLTLVSTGGTDKRIGSAAGLANVRSENNAGQLIDTIGRASQAILAGGALTYEYENSPIWVPEGQGVVILATTVNVAFNCNFDWDEI